METPSSPKSKLKCWHPPNTTVHAKSLQSCLTLCNPVDYNPPYNLSLGFSRQEYWSGLSCPSPGDLPDPGSKSVSPVAPALKADSLPLSYQGSSQTTTESVLKRPMSLGPDLSESPVFLFGLFLLPFEALWYGPFCTISTHLPFPPLWFCYIPITMYVAFVHAIKQFSDASGVSYNSAQLWHSAWRLHQVPQFETSVLQDANHKSRLLLLTDRT